MLTLECYGIAHFYGAVNALSGVDVKYTGSGCIALIGANGAGKSTLLKGLVGAHRFSQGRVYLLGEAMYPESPARAHVGYLSERVALPPDLSVAEMIYGALISRGVSRQSARESASWAIEQCELNTLRDRRCDTLSRGQRQRARLAATIAHRPSVLVLDEVHSGLDPLQTHSLNALIAEQARERLVLLSTHRLSAAESIADTYWVLDRGELIAEGALQTWSPEPHLSLEHAYRELVKRHRG